MSKTEPPSISAASGSPGPQSSLRLRILAFVGALVLLCLLGSGISLYRLTDVNRSLEAINRVSVPLGRLFVQMQSDADVYKRELDRRLGQSHWTDAHWKPRPVPKWIEDVLESEVDRANQLISKDLPWSTPESRQRWKAWAENLGQGFRALKDEDARLFTALEQKDQAAASVIFPKWTSALESWIQQVQWGATEYEHSLRQTFSSAQTQVSELRTGLEIILIVVISLSLLLLWLGERTLRPLVDLTRLAREITRRGLRKEDKALLPDISLSRTDEVSQLAREFHRMATTLLEREKMVDSQKNRLQEQNRLLREIGELNKNILNSIHSVLVVTDLDGKITQCNPVAASWLMAESTSSSPVIGSSLYLWPKVRLLPGAENWLSRVNAGEESIRIDPVQLRVSPLATRVYGGHVMPLLLESGQARGAIIVLEDLTEELDLQERLRYAEKLAAVGRMSAQVAHEVRNPLHSIGLETEIAAEQAAKIQDSAQRLPIKQSLQSIMAAVDRLEKITENYLKLSKLSAGEKALVDIGEVLESVLATYSAACESQRVRVDWTRAENSSLVLMGDRDMLEHVLGNLLQNALQALSGIQDPEIRWTLGNDKSGKILLKIEDNGPGLALEVKEKLFTPFVTTRAQGTGLGLSFVKKVIEDHGGTIQYLEPLKPQVGGACFEILFPLALDQGLVSFERQSHFIPEVDHYV